MIFIFMIAILLNNPEKVDNVTHLSIFFLKFSTNNNLSPVQDSLKIIMSHR